MGIVAFLATLMANPVFVGVGGGAIIGGLMVTLRSIPHRIWNAFLHLFTLEVHIENDDEAFYYVDKFLAQHEGAKKSRTLRLTTSRKNGENSWNYGPGLGSVWFWQGWRFIIVSRNLTEAKNGHGTREYITIRMLGRSREPLTKFLGKADEVRIDNRIRINAYTGGYWSTVARVTPRPMSTVILPQEQKTKIVDDLKWFLENKQWYMDRGIPYHRGYLFDGAPGCGKTSIISALAGEVKKDICSLSLSTLKSDKDLMEAICEADDNAIIALEDIDCATAAARTREDDKEEDGGGVTLAGLLNILDGVITPDGRIFVMTTNYPERLDAALIRPGRVDVHETFEYLNKELQEEMSKLFYEKPISREEPISPAKLQGILINHPLDREAAQKELNDA